MGIFERLAIKKQEFESKGIEIPQHERKDVITQAEQDKYASEILAEIALKELDNIPDLRINQYIAKTDKQKRAKKMAVDYANKPEGSIAFLGRPGTGKSHLAYGIARKLVEMDGEYVKIVQYNQMIQELKMARYDEINFRRVLSRYTKPKYLLLDDFLKGSVRTFSHITKIDDSEIELIFLVINERYLKRKDIILTSEYSIEQIKQLDEAIGSRIFEMCGSCVAEFGPEEENWRMR
jgi:DNA replication protein DnaC